MNFKIFGLIILALLWGCDEDEKDTSAVNSEVILEQLASNYDQLPEQAITISKNSRVFAQYTNPTDKYAHNILGDAIEAENLVVVVDGIFYELSLDDEFVFEDIRPRLYDVDGDNELEIVTIRSSLSTGAGIAIYKIESGELIEFANVTEVGNANQWLNIVAVNDMDNDGVTELIWVQTPHFGGTLRVAKIEKGTLEVLDEIVGYSNHALDDRNLCLSVLSEISGEKITYVPTQEKDKIVGFTFKNGQLEQAEEILQSVDVAKPLIDQFDFNGVIDDTTNCINEN